MRPHVERIASAAHEALRVLKSDDRVAIMVFDRSSRLRLPFRNSRDDVEREMESLLNQETFNGGTDITRALLDAASYIGREGRRDARRAIVILTDDRTERNRDVEAVSRALTKADAVLSLLLAPDAMGSYYPGTGGGRRGGGGSWPGSGPMGGPLGGIILGRRSGPYGGRGPGSGSGRRGPHTQSAETGEIARRSGGDTMPVDDASALETTLARIRQRYALYFNLPQGVKSGEERTLEVALADTARRRYADAEVRYRRTYFAPADTGKPGAEPAVNARAADESGANTQTAAAEPVPVMKRRARVGSDGPREGPLDGAATPVPTESQPEVASAPQRGSRHVDEPSQQTGPIEPPCGGWHRVNEPAPPPCPTDTAAKDQKK